MRFLRMVGTLVVARLVLCCAVLFRPHPSWADDSVFEPGAKPRQLLAEDAGEGPAWHPELGLFFSGGPGIVRWDRDKKIHVFRERAGSNGLQFDAQGRLLVCEPVARLVSRIDVKSGRREVLAERYDGKRFNQPNDVAVDSRGRIYFSDPRYGSRDGMELEDAQGRKIEGVYRIDPDGHVTRVITHEVDRPNGLVVSADDTYLFVADNNNDMPGGARKLWRFNLHGDGGVDLASRKLLFDWETERGPDGISLDRDGRLYVAGGRNQPSPPHETADKFKGGIYVFSPDGKQLGFAPVGVDEVTNCTFGDADLRTLYITAGGTLWSIRTTTPGWLPFPR